MSQPSDHRARWWLLVAVFVLCPLVGWAIGHMNGPALPPPRHETAAAPIPALTRQPAQQAQASPEPGSFQAPEPPSTNATPVVSSWTSYDDAVSESHRNDKPVLIDFNAEWCGPCRRLKQELFDDAQGGRAVQTAVIPVSIVDRRREDGSNSAETEMLQSRYQVDAFPTVVVFSPRTGRFEKMRGYGGAERMLQWVTEAAKSVR
jgi:thiol:disulfide interchange protein